MSRFTSSGNPSRQSDGTPTFNAQTKGGPVLSVTPAGVGVLSPSRCRNITSGGPDFCVRPLGAPPRIRVPRIGPCTRDRLAIRPRATQGHRVLAPLPGCKSMSEDSHRGCRFARPPTNVCDPYRGRRTALSGFLQTKIEAGPSPRSSNKGWPDPDPTPSGRSPSEKVWRAATAAE